MTCSTPSRRPSGALALLLVVALTSPAQGTEPREPEAVARARSLSDRGREAYLAADFVGSLHAYTEAYAVVPLPAFLFNIAQAHRQLGHLAAARLSYQRYLEEAQPEGAQHMLVMELISEMAQREAELEVRGAVQRVQGQAHAPLRDVRAPPAFWQQWWFWAGVGAVVVGGGALTVWATSPQRESGQLLPLQAR
ncbi:MAG: hypothetical protein L0Y66_13975 [Myxococcaceae bacterium]|nr:hypothetical protein [Myxococcaceae bacterium]MCI0671908.1 hypothetical protein [Myxococcaceae bacterium]